MKKTKAAAIMLSFTMVFTMLPWYASAEAENRPEDVQYEAGQVIVVTEEGTGKKEMSRLADEADGEIDTVSLMSDGTGVALIEVDEGSELDAAAGLSSEDSVLFAQPNYIYEFDEYPDDPEYNDGMQEYLRADPLSDGSNAGSINAAGAWSRLMEEYPQGTEKVLVGVIDSGTRLDHEDLQGCLLKDKCVSYIDGKKYGFYDVDGNDDDIGHGTNVTGIIGADIDNGKGIAGIAGGRADVFVVDAAHPDGGIRSIDIAMGIYYATDQGARLINLSLGGPSRDLLFDRATKYAWDNNALCICAAGNSGSSFRHYPGDSLYAVNVMAHDWKGKPASYTCYGIEKDISAPGSNLYTTNNLRKTSYDSFTGTSGATPVVTGAAALLLAADPDLTPRELKNLLYTSTGKEGFSAEKEGQGFGRLNIDTALGNLLSEKTPPERIVLNKTDISMIEGTDSFIEYAVYPGTANYADATFTSSNENVATVDSDGVVRAIAPGKAEIRVSCKGASTLCSVTVRETPYVMIDKKPYSTTRTITMDELTDYTTETDETGLIVNEDGHFCHQYRVGLEKGETISVYMSSNDCECLLRIRDKDGTELAADDKGKNVEWSSLRYTAPEAGTYMIQAIQINAKAVLTETTYNLKLASDRSFCQPSVNSTNYGQVRMSWPAVDGADCYTVRKYKDEGHTKIIKEETVTAARYTDTDYNSKSVQYYGVTACMQTSAGMLCNGESAVKVKMANTLTAAGKTFTVRAGKLKKKSMTVARGKAIRLTAAKGTVTYAKVSGNKKITINKKTGKVTIGKKLKRGTYKVKAKVNAAGNGSYNGASRTVTFRVRVR